MPSRPLLIAPPCLSLQLVACATEFQQADHTLSCGPRLQLGDEQ